MINICHSGTFIIAFGQKPFVTTVRLEDYDSSMKIEDVDIDLIIGRDAPNDSKLFGDNENAIIKVCEDLSDTDLEFVYTLRNKKYAKRFNLYYWDHEQHKLLK